MSVPKFKIGDIIISKLGTKPGKITYTTWSDYYEVTYLHNNRSGAISKTNAILYHGDSTMTQDSLFSFIKDDGSIGYATYLATNSAGEWVVEEKGSSVIHTKPKDSFTEVVPFTFSAKSGSQTVSFTCDEYKVLVGELLLLDGSIYQVTGLNTKAKNAPKFTGVRLVTKPF
jgi:hypothetical protein